MSSNVVRSRLRSRSLPRLLALVLLVAAVLGTTTFASPAAEASGGTAIMRPTQLTAAQMSAWFRSSSARVSGYRATVSVSTLASYYVQEGRDEGVAGDLAFVQAVLETGSFSWPGHGQVRAAQNNFAGIGACDGGACTVASFRTARIGVRAQIQHLRAYADPTVTVAKLAHPLESPRFHLVMPKGKAPTWEKMGNGNWATDPAYSRKVLDLYAAMRRHAGVGAGFVPTISTPFADVPASHPQAAAIASLAERRITTGCTTTRFCPNDHVTRAQMASFIARAAGLPAGRAGAFSDVSGTHQADIDALAAAGIANGCGAGRFCPKRLVSRAEVASFVQRTLGSPERRAPFSDVRAGSTHAGAIGALAHEGIISGYADGRFAPDAPMTRAHMASLLTRAFPG